MKIPKLIAQFLELPNVEKFTGHAFRWTSATLLAESGAHMSAIQRHGGWKSAQVTQGYVDESDVLKNLTAQKISKDIYLYHANSREVRGTRSNWSTTSRHLTRWQPEAEGRGLSFSHLITLNRDQFSLVRPTSRSFAFALFRLSTRNVLLFQQLRIIANNVNLKW